MRVVICGPRNWRDRWTIERAVDLAEAACAEMVNTTLTIVQGEAKGADWMAKDEAELRGIHVECFPADWDTYGKAAGAIRNQWMLDSGIDLVIAVAPREGLTRGTKNMVWIARKAGVKTLVLVP